MSKVPSLQTFPQAVSLSSLHYQYFWNVAPGVIGHVQTPGMSGMCGGDGLDMDVVCHIEGGGFHFLIVNVLTSGNIFQMNLLLQFLAQQFQPKTSYPKQLSPPYSLVLTAA